MKITTMLAIHHVLMILERRKEKDLLKITHLEKQSKPIAKVYDTRKKLKLNNGNEHLSNYLTEKNESLIVQIRFDERRLYKIQEKS